MKIPALLFFAALLPASAACVAAPATVMLDELTSPELAARIAAGSTTILIPIRK
jgi:hypothetical protein